MQVRVRLAACRARAGCDLDGLAGLGYIPDMTASDPPGKKTPAPDSRDARLKAALRANLGRRKAQARERAAGDEDADSDTGQDEG